MTQAKLSLSTSSASPPGPRRRSKSSSRALTVLRRIHLYSGLVLLPWVLLYGVTGFLFNHPTVASPNRSLSISKEQIEATFLAAPLELESIADEVTRLASVSLPADTEPAIAITPKLERQAGRVAALDGQLVFDADSADGSRRHRLTVDLAIASGTYRDFAVRPKPPRAPFAVADLPIGRSPEQGWRERGHALLSQIAGTEIKPPRLRSSPDVVFPVDYDGVAYLARYDLADDELSAVPESDQPGTPLRSFFLRMHKAHGFPNQGIIRTVWALLVDAMAISMVLWALSGLFMWWKIKKTRRVGLAILSLSPLAAVAVAFGMYSNLSS